MQDLRILIISTFILLFFVKSSFCPKEESNKEIELNMRQNFHEDIEQLLNEQINLKYISFYTYQTMANYFNKPTVGLMGFAKFFIGKSDEKLSHARSLTSYLNKRGGSFIPKFIYPEINKKQELNSIQGTYFFEAHVGYSGKSGLEVAFDTEKQINENFLKIIKESIRLKDPNTKFVLKGYIKEELDSMNNLQILLSRLADSKSYNFTEFSVDQEFRKKVKL